MERMESLRPGPSRIYRVVQQRKHGLDIWVITRDGQPIHCFLSREYALTRFDAIRKRLALGEEV